MHFTGRVQLTPVSSPGLGVTYFGIEDMHLSLSVERKQPRKQLNCMTAMRFALVNTWECAFLWQTTDFVGSIPKNKTKENIVEQFSKVTEGLVDVILYNQPNDNKKNRGFCFLEYEDPKSAAQARRRLMSGKVKVWGNVVTVEWAYPVEEPDPEVMAKVKVICEKLGYYGQTAEAAALGSAVLALPRSVVGPVATSLEQRLSCHQP
ncbi:hypothetical protein A6R68_12504 [Neotoma lepida]|uniref:RRM domain-containing protein n=1 Tax=Neotoma lepida TaxID=56216 RepID=A0A1A6H3P0_NEOLE|nr:hypothetical protein A6R68_12504 [Neotoma lepida]